LGFRLRLPQVFFATLPIGLKIKGLINYKYFKKLFNPYKKNHSLIPLINIFFIKNSEKKLFRAKNSDGKFYNG